MLHELLLALYGIPGSLFAETKNVCIDNEAVLDTSLIPVTENLPFVACAELSLQNELLKLGNYYKKLESFVSQFCSFFCGLYLSSIASGIDEILNDYRNCLCVLESDLLADPNVGLSHISYRLHSHKVLLPRLTKFVLKLENALYTHNSNEITSSCKLIDVILLSSVSNGLSNERFFIRIVLNQVMQIFCRQLSSWLIYGILQDPHNEFFIKRFDLPPDVEDSGSCKYHMNKLSNCLLPKRNTKKYTFRIIDVNVPTFLPPSFAQRVLVSGEAVYLASSFDVSARVFLLDLEKRFLPRFSDLIKSSNEIELDSSHYHQDDELIHTELYNLICDIQTFVSHRAWVIMLEDYKLLNYLHLVKDVLLLGRGELFLSFFDRLKLSNFRFDLNVNLSSEHRHILDYPVIIHSDNQDRSDTRNNLSALEYSLMENFSEAARSIGIDEEESLKRLFKFSFIIDESNQIQSDQTIGDCLNLEFISPPSLTSMFTPQICRAYSRLFRFLFNVRRTQLELQRFWADQTLRWREICNLKSHMNKHDSANIDKRLLIRNHMAFIIENLQYYLQVDVIESQFSHLLDRIQKDKQIELIQAAHESCLAALQAQSMLFCPDVEFCVVNLLDVSRKFVTEASNASENMVDTGLSEEEIRLCREFKIHASDLFQILSSSCLTGASSFVSFKSSPNWKKNSTLPSNSDTNQLLLRLDFNLFYSQSEKIFNIDYLG